MRESEIREKRREKGGERGARERDRKRERGITAERQTDADLYTHTHTHRRIRRAQTEAGRGRQRAIEGNRAYIGHTIGHTYRERQTDTDHQHTYRERQIDLDVCPVTEADREAVRERGPFSPSASVIGHTSRSRTSLSICLSICLSLGR